MSTKTNEPIVLNATLEEMLQRMGRKNSLLSTLVEGRRETIYSDISQIASIIRGNSVEQNEKLFPHGDQIIIPWKDMDDSNHNTDETAYQVPLNIIGHRMATLETGETVPGMFVQWHFASSYGVQFSHSQAFLNCEEGLAAGDYYVTIGSTNWGFSLTQEIPAGGRLSGFEYGTNDKTTHTVKAWASANALEPQESVTATSGVNSGTHLGTMSANSGTDGLNGYNAVYYGHNRWGTSALRQYLNSDKTGWWSSKEDYDIRPDQYAKTGFMAGFSDEFLAAIKPISVQTALNTVEGFSDTAEVTYDTFFPLSLEEMYINPQAAGVEGAYFPYWKERLGLTSPGAWHPTIHPNIITTAINAQTAAQFVRLRSALRGLSYYTWYVYASGYVSNYCASYAYRFSPVCVIC